MMGIGRMTTTMSPMVFIMPAARRFLVSDMHEGCGLKERVQYIEGLLRSFVNTAFWYGKRSEWMKITEWRRKVQLTHTET